MTEDAMRAPLPRRRRWSYAAVLALAVFSLAVAACGDDEEEPSGAAGDGAAATADAPEGDPIITYTFTDVNTEGPQYKNIQETARVYQEWVNANGGIAGRPLEARFCDARGTPTDAAACARKAVQDKAVAVVGNFTFTGDAIVPILDKAGISYFGNCCALSAAELTTKTVFPMGNQPLYGVGLVKRAVEDGCESMNGVIIEGAEAFQPLLDNAAKNLDTEIGKYVTLPATARDYSPQVAEATDGADCLIMIVSETPYVAWMSAYAQSGDKPTMYGPQGNLNEVSVRGNEQAAEGAIVGGMYPDLALPQWDDFRSAIDEYEADPDQDYNSLGGMGTWAAYTGFKQIVEAIEGDITAESFLAQVPKTKFEDGLGGMVPPLDFSKPWSDDGGPEGFDRLFHRCVIFSQIKDGKVEPLTEEFEDVSELAGGTNPADCG